MLVAFLIACVIILGSIIIGIYNNKIVLIYPKTHFHYHGNNTLGLLSNWDSVNYLSIARHGYTNIKLASFFPLYPLLIRGLYYIIRSYIISSLIISWLSLVGAIYFYIKIIRQLKFANNLSEIIKSVLFLVLFPTAIFFVAGYTESLFAFLALGAIYYVLKHRYLWSSVLLLLAGMCHISAIFILLLVFSLLIEERSKIRYIIANMVSGGLGIMAFMIILKIKYHNALAFISSQKKIHKWLVGGYFNIIKSASILNIVFILLVILAAIYFWKKKKSFSLYSLSYLLIPIIGQQYGGFNRYVLMDFPIQFMLYDYFKNKKQAYIYVILISSHDLV